MKPLANSLTLCDCTFFIRCHKHNLCHAFGKTTLIALAIVLSPFVTIVFGFCPSHASTNCFQTQIKEYFFSWTTRAQPNITVVLLWLLPTSTTSSLYMHYIYRWSQMQERAQKFYNQCVNVYQTKASSLTCPPHLLYILRMYHLLLSFLLSMPKEFLTIVCLLLPILI